MKNILKRAIIIYLVFVSPITMCSMAPQAQTSDLCNFKKYPRYAYIFIPATKVGCWLGEIPK